MTIRPEKREETPQREESPKATVTHVIRVSASGEAHVTAEGQVTSRPSSDYDTDILLWSERQAGLLRRRA